MVRVLLTGFAPFDGAAMNPSWEAARLAAATPWDGFSVAAVELPCVFGDSIAELYRQVARIEPDLVVAVGLAAGRAAVSVERVAVNIVDPPGILAFSNTPPSPANISRRQSHEVVHEPRYLLFS